MPEFTNSETVESICFQMRQADWPRGMNRAEIDRLMNGHPPYTESQVNENNIEVNVNYLEGTRLAHDARAQFIQAFTKPGNYFTAKTDFGPHHKRQEYGVIVTGQVNRIMKKSLPYLEVLRNKAANNVLHGIAPCVWETTDKWRPKALSIADLLVPALTELSFENLPFFCIRRSFTAPELTRIAQATKRDPGWNTELVRECIKWVDRESMALLGSNYNEVWSPEAWEERLKGDGGWYMGDQVPTIDCFDFYYYSDEGRDNGWRRRIVLDNWSAPASAGLAWQRKGWDIKGKKPKEQWLYSSGSKKVASSWQEIFSCQFADLSSVAPFRYHTVRSLGFLLYSICHMQNRLRCKFTEAVFEQLMMLYKVRSADDVQRALKINLITRGFIDDSISFVPAAERFQPRADFVELGLREQQNLIEANASSYVQNQNYSQDRTEKTKFQVMAEVNAMTNLISASLSQAYEYQRFEYVEIFRRFMKKGSRDADVNLFQAACLKNGVPPKMLDAAYWEIEPERIMGGGNKTLEMAMSQQLMEYIDRFDPEPQRIILRRNVMSITDDASLANELVPEKPVAVTDSVHDAQLAAGALMMGLPVALKTGMNHIEYVETMLPDMALIIQKGMNNGGMLSKRDIDGLLNMASHISEHIKIIAQDPEEKARVKIYNDQLSKLMNEVRAFAQRLQEQMASRNGGQGGEDAAKIQSQMLQAQVKAQNARESHAQKTAQRQIQWEHETAQKEAAHTQDMAFKAREAQLDLSRKVQENAIDLAHEKAKVEAAKNKPKPKQDK